MLTIEEIKNISFRKATLSSGYRAEDVDAFIDEVIATFEQQKKERNNLVNKIDRLAARLEEYKEDEETVRNALITSQKISDACMKEAREKAAVIISEAEEKAAFIVNDAETKTAIQKETYLKLQSDAVDLRNELIELYSRHIQTIDELPTASDVEKTRELLEEKYPTSVEAAAAEVAEAKAAAEPAEAPKAEAEAPAEPAEAPKEEAKAAAEAPEEEVKAPAEAPKEEKKATAEPEEEELPELTARVPLKRPAKFKHLKFGDNYDVADN